VDRWEKLLGLVLVFVVVGLLAGLLLVLVRLEQRGLVLRLEGSIQAGVLAPPLDELKVTLSFPQELALSMRGTTRVEGGLQAQLSGVELGIPCPKCGKGVLVPVRWNLWSGEIVWKCSSCGEGLTGR